MKIAEIDNELTPLYFILPEYMAWGKDEMKVLAPLMNHENRIERLSSVKMVVADRELSGVENYLNRLGIIRYQAGKRTYIELEFDKNRMQKEIDFIKELSLLIKY